MTEDGPHCWSCRQQGHLTKKLSLETGEIPQVRQKARWFLLPKWKEDGRKWYAGEKDHLPKSPKRLQHTPPKHKSPNRQTSNHRTPNHQSPKYLTTRNLRKIKLGKLRRLLLGSSTPQKTPVPNSPQPLRKRNKRNNFDRTANNSPPPPPIKTRKKTKKSR